MPIGWRVGSVAEPMTGTEQLKNRAEHPSLMDYLRTRLSDQERERVLIASFNHWEFGMAAVAETALTLDAMGSQVFIALWASRTPLHDEGWMADRRLCRMLATRSPDHNLEQGLRKAGISPTAFLAPSITPWRPRENISIGRRMNRSAIRALTYRGTPAGKGILQVHPDRQTPITDDYLWPRRWVDRSLRSYAWTYDQAEAAIRRHRITAVMVNNGRFLHDRAVVEAAKSAGIPILATDTGGFDTDFDLTAEATHDWDALQQRMLKAYGSWDPKERRELGDRWFEMRAEHADPWNTLFVEAQRKGTTLPDRPDGTLVVFFSSSGDEIAELDIDWDTYFGSQGQALEAVARICRELPDTTLVVRSHPHKRMKPERDVHDWLADVARAQPDIHLDPFSQVDSYALMRQADIVVTYGSTTGIEAAFAGKPVIVMGPSIYDQIDAATPVHSEADLREALKTPTLPDPDRVAAFGLLMMRRGFCVERVQHAAEGGYKVEDIRFMDVKPLAMKVNDLVDRAQRRRLRAR
jgi:hypothetical protein